MIEKAMYLKGLCDGVELDKTTKEGKLIAALLDMVMEMAEEMDAMQAKMSDLEAYCEELDEDLGDVEEVLLELDDEDYFDDEDEEDFDFEDCDGNCAACDFDCGDFDDEDEEEDEDNLDYFHIVCPTCGGEIYFDDSIDPENLICPGCGAKMECIVCEEDYKEIVGEDAENTDHSDEE